MFLSEHLLNWYLTVTSETKSNFIVLMHPDIKTRITEISCFISQVSWMKMLLFHCVTIQYKLCGHCFFLGWQQKQQPPPVIYLPSFIGIETFPMTLSVSRLPCLVHHQKTCWKSYFPMTHNFRPLLTGLLVGWMVGELIVRLVGLSVIIT